MYSTKSKFHDIELIEYGVVEPNNGRMLSEVDLKINGAVVTARYFSASWHHVHLYEKYEPDSPDGRFFFVPKEGGGFLLDTHHDFMVIGLPYKALSAASYIGNAYFADRLFLVYRDEVVVFHLVTQKPTIQAFPRHRVKWVKPINTHQFELSYYEAGTWVEKTVAVAFE
jgi:hypothetical protein